MIIRSKRGRRLTGISCISLCAAALCALTACGGRGTPSPVASAGASRAAGGEYDAEKVLNIYTWADYIAPDTVANFEKQTGIKVHYDIFDTNETLETHLLTGHTNYDIVIPTGPFFERLTRAGAFRTLDPSALPNRVNLDPDIMRRLALHDPGNLHAVPYLWSTTGIGYNVAQVRARLGAEPPRSWSMLFEPHSAAKLADCGITIIDAPSDVFPSVLLYLGRDPNSRNPADLTAAFDVLMKIRPFVRYIDSSQYLSDLANGSVCASLGWSGDAMQARGRAQEAGNGVKLDYFVPREGGLIIVDMIGIPADAPHPRNAQAWMNYLMRPEVMAGITNWVKYANGNLASLPLVTDAIRNDPIIYPDAATRAKLHAPLSEPLDHSRIVTRLWTRFRTGS